MWQLIVAASIIGQFPGMGPGMGSPPEVEPGTHYVKHINQQIYDEIVKPEEMWMLKFYAPWCAATGKRMMYAPATTHAALRLPSQVRTLQAPSTRPGGRRGQRHPRRALCKGRLHTRAADVP